MTAAATVKSIYRTFGDSDLDGVLATFDREVEWITPRSLPWSRGRYQGPDEVREYFGAFLSALDHPRVEYEELLEVGDRVVAVGYERGRCRATGRHFAARFVHLWTIRDGRVMRMEGVADTASVAEAFAPTPAVV